MPDSCVIPSKPPSSSAVGTLEQILICRSTAPSRDLHKSLPACFSHELHLPAVLAVLEQSYDNNDNQPLVEENLELDIESTCIPPCSRLGIAPATDEQPTRFQRSHGLAAPRGIALFPRSPTGRPEHKRHEQYLFNN